MICKNCGHKFEGNYCNNCGQKSNVGNINFKNTINDVLNGLFQIDKGFFFTIKELFIRPGNSIKQYIEGKRKKYFNPFSYIIICSLIFILINYFTTYETSLFKFTNGFVEGVPKGGPKNTIILLEKIFEWLTTHYAYTILILLPVFSLSSFFSFKKYGYNYFEHFVLNAYIKGQQIIILTIVSVISVFIKNETAIEYGQIVLGILYTIWVYFQFFKSKKAFLRIIHTLLTYIYYYIMIILISLIIVAVFILILDTK